VKWIRSILKKGEWGQDLTSCFINGGRMKITAIVLCVFFSVGVVAADTESEQKHSDVEGHHKHVLGLFLGVTDEGDDYLETYGIEYAYRIHEYWSVGGGIEHAKSGRDSTLAIAGVGCWPDQGLFLGAGVGRKDPRDKREKTFRATIGYEIEFAGGWGIAPQINWDFIDGHEDEEVYGIVIGKRF